MRLVDINVGETRPVACSWKIPGGLRSKHFDVRLQVWNPHKLFDGSRPFLFFDSGWVGGFEVITALPKHIRMKAFISYSWDNREHRAWVRDLVEELRKHNIDCIFDQSDLMPGEEATAFMERGIGDCGITLLICTTSYTRKADAREPGGVGFETIVSSHEYLVRAPHERSRFIPIVRANVLPNGRKLPRYLGSAFYVDMSGDNWRATPMLALVNAIRRHIDEDAVQPRPAGGGPQPVRP